MIPVIWRSRIVGSMPPMIVSNYLPVVRFAVLPRLALTAPPADAATMLNIETVDMRVVDRSATGEPGELHVDTLRHLLKLQDFSPEDRWLALLTEADEE
jgi:hypothetical protein